MTLTKRELNQLKEKIEVEKKRILDSHCLDEKTLALEKEGCSDDLDAATADFDNMQKIRMRKRDIFYFKKLEDALSKFDSDSYGLCEDCGCEIKVQRLLARPTAELCITCKEDSERTERSNVFLAKSKSYTETQKIY